MTNWTVQDFGRIIVTAALIVMFLFALVHELLWGQDAQTRNLLIGALIGAFTTGGVQFWFGTTPQSAAKDATIAQMAANAANPSAQEPKS